MVVLLADIHRDTLAGPAFRFWCAILRFLSDMRPDGIVSLGDSVDFISGSRHVGDFDAVAFEKDQKWVALLMGELTTASPGSWIDIFEGNHETNWARYLAANAPRAKGILSVRDEFKKHGARNYYAEAEQPQPLGTLDLIHSHQQFAKGAPKHHAMKMVEVYGTPGRTVVYGHTHKPQAFEGPSHGGNKRAVCLGCVRSLEPGWLKGQKAGWANEFGVAYVRADGTTDLHVIRWERDAFSWGPRLYRADAEWYGRTFGHLEAA